MRKNTDTIAETFLKKFDQARSRFGWEMNNAKERIYLEGMVDILDAISENTPEDTYILFKIREAIEDKLEETENETNI